jgi:hypothetical protein
LPVVESQFDKRNMSILGKLLGGSEKKKEVSVPEQVVVVHLPGSGLPDEVYEKYDVSTLQDQLREAIKKHNLGEFGGNENGPEETLLFMYGPDAEALFAGVEPVLKTYPLCRGGRAVIRRGPPGAPEREVRFL